MVRFISPATIVSTVIGIFIFLYFHEVVLYQKILLIASILFGATVIAAYQKEKKQNFFWLIVPALICLVIALSNEVYLGETRVLKYSVFESGIGGEFFKIIRSSGRFFWVTTLIFIVSFLSLIFDYSKTKPIAFSILGLCLILQIADLSAINKYVNNERKGLSPKAVPEVFQEMIAASNKVDFIDCKSLEISLVAIKNNIPINSFYMVHGNGELTKNRINKEILNVKGGIKLLNDTTLYFMKKSQLWDPPPINKLNYYNYNHELYAVTTKNFKYTNNRLKKIIKERISLTNLIDKIPESKLLIIAVKDEATKKLPHFFSENMDSLYGGHLSSLKYRQAYIAVYNKGELLFEKVGVNDKEAHYQGEYNGYKIDLLSAGDKGNIAVIKINGVDYSKNARGLNVLHVDSLGVFSSYHFDTHGIDYLN